MDAAGIRAWDLKAREHYRPHADLPDYDTWRDHADDILAGRDWAGDCDDLTSSVLELLGRAGMPLTQRFRLLVKVSKVTKAPCDHMLGCCIDDAGGFWIVGDALGGEAYPAQSFAYGAYAYQRLDEWTIQPPKRPVAIWRDGLPWRPA